MNAEIEIFDQVIELPNPNEERRFGQLVGLDNIKARLTKEGALLLTPTLLDDWSKKHYGYIIPLVKVFGDRPPLFLFAGDVGTGKTSLARCFGDPIARQGKVSMKLFSLSLNARGTGTVGEMTMLISQAFEEVRKLAKRSPKSSIILLIDEADAIAQSREFAQMHHEDRAGVNALIRGIDSITSDRLRVLIVMCTNRLSAIDPAVYRRAAGVFNFPRPNDVQRHKVLESGLDGAGFSKDEITKLVFETGTINGRKYGFTYSDLTQRLLPTILLEAYPNHPLLFNNALAIARSVVPTPPFKENGL